MCNGQVLPINRHRVRWSLRGTTAGGNGQTTFGRPDLRGRVSMHTGNGHILGERGGEESHILSVSEMPSHIHGMMALAANADQNLGGISPVGHSLAQGVVSIQGGGTAPAQIYGQGAPNRVMASSSIGNYGGGQGHENRQPFLTLNFCIALQGIFPSQN